MKSEKAQGEGEKKCAAALTQDGKNAVRERERKGRPEMVSPAIDWNNFSVAGPAN